MSGHSHWQNNFVAKSLAAVVLPLLLIALSTGCRQSTTSRGIEDIPSVGATPTPTPDPNGGIGPESGNFKISTSLPYSTITAYLHNATSFDANCEIASTDTDKDIDCIYDINELDLYFNTVTLGVSVPQSMCDYVITAPSWFYMAKPAIGPSSVQLAQNATGTLSVISQTPAASNSIAAATIRDNILSCETDYTYDEGPNCCTGTYSGTLASTDSNGVTTTSSISGSWGGEIGNCAAGPGADGNWGRTSEQNIPMTKMWYAKDGLTYSYPITSPISQGFGRNIFSANYVSDPSNPPYPFSSTYGVQASINPRIYHTFQCLDHAWEVQMQIRLMVREWNMMSELAKKSAGDPDTTGSETDFPSESINDRADWGDMTPTAWPGYDGL